MAGYNRVVMIGNLTRDPEYKQLTSGQAVCRLGLATNRQFKNRQTGNMVQEVCYVDIDVWGAQAESCRQYLQKGRSVLIEGRLKFDTWKDPEGQTRSKHTVVADRVVFLSSNHNNGGTVAGVVVDKSAQQEQRLDPNNALEKDILDQLDSIKNRKEATPVQPKQKATPAPAQVAQKPAEQAKQPEKDASAGEVVFKDEPPFQDDLPF